MTDDLVQLDARAEQFGAPTPDGDVSEDVGLCLSGGGYKAALFNPGALIRLNELGALPKLDRVSSVFDGSITAAWLGLNWSKLNFDAAGRADNFDVLIRQPVEHFCRTAKIDKSARILGLLNPFQTAGQYLERAYARLLIGEATLQDLPKRGEGAPEFVLNATNMQLNSLCRFSRTRAADHKVGEVRLPDFPLWGDRRALLTRDARGDYVLEGLEIAGILFWNKPLDRPLDILKLPHHGSIRNVDLDFFTRLPARHYVASGDGWFGNPDLETLGLLEAARPDGDYTLHLTYTSDHMDRESARYLAPKPFDPAKHSTASTLQRVTAAGATIRTGPVSIDLAASP